MSILEPRKPALRPVQRKRGKFSIGEDRSRGLCAHWACGSALLEAHAAPELPGRAECWTRHSPPCCVSSVAPLESLVNIIRFVRGRSSCGGTFGHLCWMLTALRGCFLLKRNEPSSGFPHPGEPFYPCMSPLSRPRCCVRLEGFPTSCSSERVCGLTSATNSTSVTDMG